MVPPWLKNLTMTHSFKITPLAIRPIPLSTVARFHHTRFVLSTSSREGARSQPISTAAKKKSGVCGRLFRQPHGHAGQNEYNAIPRIVFMSQAH